MKIAERRVRDALNILETLIRGRPDGELLVPIYIRLERELAAYEDSRSVYERIKSKAPK